jgi:hypothetical protein
VAFVTNQGLFEPKVMFFGLTNPPATFQSLMNSIFADLITQGKVAVYLDDILILSSTLEEHRKVVHKVLHRLQMYNLYLHPEKCEFKQAKVDYLDLVISHGRVSMNPVKIEAVVEHGVYPAFYSVFLLFLPILLSLSKAALAFAQSKAPFSASHHVCASFLLLNTHQTPRQSSRPLASLISKLLSSDLLE